MPASGVAWLTSTTTTSTYNYWLRLNHTIIWYFTDISGLEFYIRYTVSGCLRQSIYFTQADFNKLYSTPAVLRRSSVDYIRRQQPLHFRYSIPFCSTKPFRFTTPFRYVSVPLHSSVPLHLRSTTSFRSSASLRSSTVSFAVPLAPCPFAYWR